MKFNKENFCKLRLSNDNFYFEYTNLVKIIMKLGIDVFFGNKGESTESSTEELQKPLEDLRKYFSEFPSHKEIIELSLEVFNEKSQY